jgi:hypothetical protein
MRMSRPALLAFVPFVCLAAFACGHGKPDGQCAHNFDCPAGQACVNSLCKVVPCGGCQPDEACGNDGNCVAAQGASCADHTCPDGYPCSAGGVCAKKCVVSDTECDPGFYCLNKACVACSNNDQCAAKPTGKTLPICDTTRGLCVECVANFDCTHELGSGHFCDAHVCKVGCATDADCNPNLGEKCDTSTTPGKCIQCHSRLRVHRDRHGTPGPARRLHLRPGHL